jgi:hypothetical protein
VSNLQLFTRAFHTWSRHVILLEPGNPPKELRLLQIDTFPYGLPKVQLPLYKLNKVNSRLHICFYRAIGGPKRCFCWGHAQCSQKNCWRANQYGSLKEKRKNCGHTHYLINMNHTLCPQNLIIKDSFFTICPYPDSYFYEKTWVMPKHIWTLNYTCFGCVMNLRQNFITQEITHILLGNWADTRKEMQE